VAGSKDYLAAEAETLLKSREQTRKDTTCSREGRTEADLCPVSKQALELQVCHTTGGSTLGIQKLETMWGNRNRGREKMGPAWILRERKQFCRKMM